MAGNREGGLKAAQTLKDKYGKDHYRTIGRLGGRAGHTGGFAGNPEKARAAGIKGAKARAEKYNKLKELNK